MSTLCELLNLHATQQGSATAILAPGRSALTYAQLMDQVNATIDRFRQLGIGRQSRLVIVLPDGPAMAVILLAASCAAIGAPLHPGYTAAEFEFYLTDLAPTAVIVAAELESPVRAVAQACGILLIEVTTVGERAGAFTLSTQATQATITTSALATAIPNVQSQDIALLLHTSGSTARPKLIPLSQCNLYTSAQQIAATLQLTATDRCLNVMPLFHIHSLVGALLATLVAGGSIVCTAGFEPTAFSGWLTQFQPTWYTAVPTIHQAILTQATQQPTLFACASLRFIRSSSAPLPPGIMAELERIFQVPVIEAYGMTETAGQICSNPLPPGQRKAGSVGRAAGPAVAIMAVGSDHLLAPGEWGEVVVRGASVMTGYANGDIAMPTAFTQGWFHTGDQGYLDADGYLFISGRLKEVINRGGEKVAPREVDEALLRHPAVAQAVTFGVPHATLGEDVNAAVVLQAGSVTTERDLRHFVVSQVANYKVPTQIVIVDAIPQGTSGKIQRNRVAAILANKLLPDFVAPTGALRQAIAQIWAEVLGQTAIGMFDNFFTRGGNSLLAMQAITHIFARLHTPIRPSQFFAAPTVAALAEVILLARMEQMAASDLLTLLTAIETLSPTQVRQAQLGVAIGSTVDNAQTTTRTESRK